MASSQLQTFDSTLLHTHLLFIRRKCCNLKGVYGAMFHVCCFLHKITLVRQSESSLCAIKTQTIASIYQRVLLHTQVTFLSSTYTQSSPPPHPFRTLIFFFFFFPFYNNQVQVIMVTHANTSLIYTQIQFVKLKSIVLHIPHFPGPV